MENGRREDGKTKGGEGGMTRGGNRISNIKKREEWQRSNGAIVTLRCHQN